MTQQLGLFDAPIVDPTPVAPVRRRDPDTSHAAARANRGRHQSQRMALLEAFSRDEAIEGIGYTDEELADVVGLDRVAATRRLSEMRSHGWIIDTGLRRPTRTGCMAMVCVVTDAGLDVLREERTRGRL